MGAADTQTPPPSIHLFLTNQEGLQAFPSQLGYNLKVSPGSASVLPPSIPAGIQASATIFF